MQLIHPKLTRRQSLQAGAISLLGLGSTQLAELRGNNSPKAKSVIYIFLSGGLGQHDSFDMKPNAPAEIRGEFKPIATKTPGTQICEHLPMLASRSERWSLIRSLTHKTNDHSAGHFMMLTGRSTLPQGFNPNQPRPADWPSIAAIAKAATQSRNNLPPAVVLPEKLVHRTGRVIPGQFAGIMGNHREPWFLEASPFDSRSYGAYPAFRFDHQDKKLPTDPRPFELPNLSLPEFMNEARLKDRVDLLKSIDQQVMSMHQSAATEPVDRHRAAAISLLTDAKIRKVFDIKSTPEPMQDLYGRNAFGWSLLMAARLVEAGVNMVQVNLGNNETWDTHGNAFPHLKDQLYPPTDRALSALLDDLHERGLLDSTLIIMAGEFGRTPKISTLAKEYAKAGRDHWGAVQAVFVAGGGVQGGRVIGSSDKMGAFPATEPHSPENFAATIYHALGIPKETHWQDAENRPHFIYHGEPIEGLFRS
jgi:hypothetical protein